MAPACLFMRVFFCLGVNKNVQAKINMSFNLSAEVFNSLPARKFFWYDQVTQSDKPNFLKNLKIMLELFTAPQYIAFQSFDERFINRNAPPEPPKVTAPEQNVGVEEQKVEAPQPQGWWSSVKQLAATYSTVRENVSRHAESTTEKVVATTLPKHEGVKQYLEQQKKTRSCCC